MKKMFLFMFLMMMFTLNVNAEACDAYDIKRLKEIAEGVEITYELQEPYDNEGTMIYDRYKIKISGVTDEIYVYDKGNDFKIDSDGFEYISLKNGAVDFVIYSNYCPNLLKRKSITLPIYNYYHTSEECKKIDYEISYCDKYLDEYIGYDQFYSKYNDYIARNVSEKNNSIYIYLILGIIVISIVLIFFFRKKREESLL